MKDLLASDILLGYYQRGMNNQKFDPVALAKKAVAEYLEGRKFPETPVDLPLVWTKQAGVFVSIKKAGKLRGCIGTFSPTQPSAAREVVVNAVSAATQDPRFTAVVKDELPDLKFSVDVLSMPEEVSSFDELDPHKYGILVKRHERLGLLLPDLDGVDTVEEQVGIAKQKAGISPDEEVDLFRFTVTRYRE